MHLRKIAIILCIGWFLTIVKHFWILPIVGEDHDITGFEFRIKF